MTFTGNSVGDTATYSCDSGFELIGNVITTCTLVDENSPVFSPAPPFCRRECCMNKSREAMLVEVNHEIHFSKLISYIHIMGSGLGCTGL